MDKMLVHSLNRKEKIEIIYLSSNKSVSQRVIRVLKIDEETILAFCFLKKNVRHFKVDNILAVAPVIKRAGA